MNALHNLSMALWQEPSISYSDGHWMMISLVVLASLALIQFLVLAVAGVKIIALVKQVSGTIYEVKGKTVPVIQKTTDIIHDLQPKIQTLSENVVQLSYLVRSKADEVGETVSQVNRTVQEVNQTVSEANAKTRSQVGHVDRMVSTALTSTEDITKTVVHGINVPIKQVAGVIAGLRVGFETLMKNFSGGPKRSRTPGGLTDYDPLP